MAQGEYLGRYIFCIISITRVIIFMDPETSYHYHRHILIQVAYLAASDAVKHKNKTSLQWI